MKNIIIKLVDAISSEGIEPSIQLTKTNNKMTARLFIGNLPIDIRTREIEDLFYK
jgi:hypothetical protein